jgi:dTDP-4-amino-4,6-dideoxygalactose transaminase
MKYLTSRNIPAARHYPTIHQQPAYAVLAQCSPIVPNTEALLPEILSLPLYPYLAREAVEYTVDAIHDFFS